MTMQTGSTGVTRTTGQRGRTMLVRHADVLVTMDGERRELRDGGLYIDPVAALVFCAPSQVSTSVIGGKVVVKDGVLTTVDLGPVIERHNSLARTLYESAA